MNVREIANTDLTLGNVPKAGANWLDLGEFALTFDGYKAWGSCEKCAEIANAQKKRTLTDLRTCLFFEQRRWRHFGEDPDETTMKYLWAVVEDIRELVAAGEVS